MRAVNLIPLEERRGRLPARTGPLAYVVVGVLVAMLAGVTLMVLTGKQISDRKAEAAQLEGERAAAETKVEGLREFAEFATMEELRTATVTSLAQSRFDWERVLRELALVLPEDVWLIGLTGTASPAIQLESGAVVSIRDTVPGPALELIGCTVSQESVGRFVAALGDIDGVTRVAVSKSELPEQSTVAGPATTGSGDAGGEDECRTRDFITRFEIVAAFDEVPAPELALPPEVPSGTPPAGEGEAAAPTESQESVGEGVQEGQEAANLAPGA